MASMAKKFSLNNWAGEYGLTAPTVDAMPEEKLVEMEVLTELTEDDIPQVDIKSLFTHELLPVGDWPATKN